MGCDAHAVRFVVDSLRSGVDYQRTLMIGRQTLNVDPRRFKTRLARHNSNVTDGDVQRILTEAGGFAEPFFRWCGAQAVDSMDNSDYEKATIIHDLNTPVGPALHGRFSAVFDGGSLEHVFNFPVALKNCMEMVAPGGHLLICTPANNNFGHGFYQFSAELFYRALSPQNGFEVVRMIVHGSDPEAPWYQVADPEKVRKRVTLINTVPTSLLVCARRAAVVPVFAKPPQQSDYQVVWNEGAPAGSLYSGGPAKSRFRSRVVPNFLRQWIVNRRGARAPLDPQCFRRVD